LAKAARQIGQHYQLTDADLMIVVVAAWFHDIGYLQGGVDGHEEAGSPLRLLVFSASYGEGTDGGVFLAKLGFQF
jgi:hypothetical protein